MFTLIVKHLHTYMMIKIVFFFTCVNLGEDHDLFKNRGRIDIPLIVSVTILKAILYLLITDHIHCAIDFLYQCHHSLNDRNCSIKICCKI